MKRIADEIVNGKNLEENLSVFATKLMNVYNDYSYIRLSMNYFTYYEMVREAKHKDELLSEIVDVFNEVVEKGIVRDADTEELKLLIKNTESIRSKVIDIMNGLTAYVDIFNIYEYCLNRVQYRFEDGSEYLKQSDEELTKDVLKYILSEQDNVVINGKITEIVRQLPMRMTKNKFFEYLAEGMKVYKGSQKSSVEDFLFMLQTTSMVSISPNIDLLGEDIKAVYNEFKKVTFSDITKEQYNDLRAKKEFAVNYIMDEIDMYMSLGELVNDAYVILMSSIHKEENSRDREICTAIIDKVNRMFTEESVDLLYESITDDFIKLEGRQETLNARFSKYEYVVESVTDEKENLIESLELKETYDSLKKIALLESGSIFVEFGEKDNTEADSDYIMKMTEEFIGKLQKLFKENEKLLNRAVMAHVLSGLPVFFNNIDEIQSYIYTSLSNCSDKAEKAAVVEILKQLEMEY